MEVRDEHASSRAGTYRRFAADLRRRLGRVELPVLLLTLAVLGGIWVFAEVADAVTEGDTHALDRSVLVALRNPADLSDPLGPRWLEELGRDFTALGGMGVLTLLTLFVVGYLLIRRKRRAALFAFAAIGGGLLLSTLLKLGFDRPRPDLVPHASHVYTASFPSGHSMLAAVTFLTLGALLARIHAHRRLKVYFFAIAIFLTVCVGVSRVYMGVHWPTDVLAGWAGGASWALLCWLAALWLQHRGHVEEEVQEADPADEEPAGA